MKIKSKELDIEVSSAVFSITKMDIKRDLKMVAISSNKKTTFFEVFTGARKSTDDLPKEFRDDDLGDSDQLPELLMSPDFKYGIFEFKFEGQRFVSILHLDGPKQGNKLKLMPIEHRNKTNEWETNELMAFFTIDNKYCGIKTKDQDYQLFRCEDGRLVCNLRHNYFEFAFSLGAGGFIVAVGLIDLVSRKCTPWSIKGLIHFARHDMHLLRIDKEDELDSEIQILGSPMPALFPMLLRRFQKNSDESSRKEQMVMLMKYTVYPHCINLLHWMSKRNMPNLITHYLERQDRTRYFTILGSPLLLATTRCANALNTYLTDRGHTDLIQEMNHDTIVKCIMLPDSSSIPLFNKLAPENDHLTTSM